MDAMVFQILLRMPGVISEMCGVCPTFQEGRRVVQKDTTRILTKQAQKKLQFLAALPENKQPVCSDDNT